MRRSETGLTLVELLVSSVLLGTVMIVLIQAVGLATTFAGQAHREAQGLPLLETLFVKLKAGAIPITESSEGTFEEQGFAAIRYEIKSETDQTNSALYRVTASIFWPAGSGEQSLQATRLFYQADDSSKQEETDR